MSVCALGREVGVESEWGGWGGGVKRETVLIKVSSLSVLVDKHFKKLCR